MASIMEEAFALARSYLNAVAEICEVLEVHRMSPADHIQTAHEVRDYVASGDVGELRALMQHAKARRENWSRSS